MKFLTVFAVIFLLQTINGQQVQQQVHNNQVHVGGVQGVKVPSPVVQHNVAQQHQQQVHSQQVHVGVGVQGVHVPSQVVQNVHNSQQHVVQHEVKDTVNQHNMQHVVSNNSKPRMVRALINRRNAQTPYKVQDVPSSCNYICDHVNRSMCGFNGLCYREFESQCELNTYNCINTQKIFQIVDDIKCMDETTVKCYRGDM